MKIDIKDIPAIATAFIRNTKRLIGVADPKIEELAAERYATCLTCDTISDDKKVCDEAKGGCSCPLYLRTRGDKGCVKNNWKR